MNHLIRMTDAQLWALAAHINLAPEPNAPDPELAGALRALMVALKQSKVANATSAKPSQREPVN